MEEKIKIKKITLWKTATAVLGILLIISILTNGFSLSSKPTKNQTITTPAGLVVIELNDERCDECDISGIISQLKQLLPELEVQSIDYSSEQGQELYDDLDLNALPALLFTEEVKDQEGYANLENYVENKGEYLSLKIGASFDPTKEICDNEIDDTGNGKIDCEDPDCASKLTCNPDALVECAEPYGIDAETVIFYYSNTCPWCQKMKPGVEQLEDEGYSIYWAEASNAEESEVIDKCIREYMTSGGIPQFICLKNAQIHVGAFADENGDLNYDSLKKFVDDCIA